MKNVKKPFELSVGSAQDYDDLIAEILFPGKFGVIISQEHIPGKYNISFHSFDPGAVDDFDYSRHNENLCVDLDLFRYALIQAIEDLDGQKKILKN